MAWIFQPLSLLVQVYLLRRPRSNRDRCAMNIVIRGLPVCDSTILADRISADQTILSEIFSTMYVSLPACSKLQGRVASGTYPAKVIFI